MSDCNPTRYTFTIDFKYPLSVQQDLNLLNAIQNAADDVEDVMYGGIQGNERVGFVVSIKDVDERRAALVAQAKVAFEDTCAKLREMPTRDLRRAGWHPELVSIEDIAALNIWGLVREHKDKVTITKGDDGKWLFS